MKRSRIARDNMMNYVVIATATIVGLVSVLPRYVVLWGSVGFFSGIGLVGVIAYYVFQQLYGSLNEGEHKTSLAELNPKEGKPTFALSD